MRALKWGACLILLLIPVLCFADEKAKAQDQINAAKAAVEAFARKAGDNKAVTRDIEEARAALKRSEDALAGKRGMFGLGDLDQEAATGVKHLTDLAEMHLLVGQSRLDAAKAAEELKVLSAQVAKVRAKVKVFEERKAELERLRLTAEKHEVTVKELAAAKAENVKLLDKQKSLSLEVEFLKGELARRSAPATVVEAAKPPAVVEAAKPPVLEAMKPSVTQ